MAQVKTYEEWKGPLEEYLQMGDIVDEEMVDHFINVMPPALFTHMTIQMGEPFDHVNGKATYHTLIKTEHGWKYAGDMHRLL